MQNLRAIKPGSGALVNFFRTYRVFWNYSWTLADNVRFSEHRTVPDWEFEGLNHFEQMISDPSGAIMLTAHMGSYDLGANLFASTSGRTVVMVRAPEQEAETHQYEESRWNSQSSESLRVGFNTATSDLAFDLLQSVQRGEIVAIQGDRVTGGVAALETALFGMRTRLPAGPFALAMATGAAIYPMFVVRLGRRRYRLVACPPIRVTRTSRNRDEDLGTGLEAWRAALEASISRGWMQWFTFEPFFTGSSS
jgi:lauroyl/myristoyl acyltransferase